MWHGALEKDTKTPFNDISPKRRPSDNNLPDCLHWDLVLGRAIKIKQFVSIYLSEKRRLPRPA